MALSSSILLNRLRDLMQPKIYFKDIADASIVQTADAHQVSFYFIFNFFVNFHFK
jgi:hypothetical protein